MIKRGILIAVIVGICLSSLFSIGEKKTNFNKNEEAVDITSTNFENIEVPDDFNWRRFKGVTLNFIVENNLNANILSKESEEFTDITGINIKIRAMDYNTLVEKINLDFISKKGKYEILYLDPYQTLNRFYNNLQVLNKYNEDPALPHIQGGFDDFIDSQITVSSYFLDNKKIYTVPFDSTTMILYYRKDIFDQYRDAFIQDKGYDWTPGTKDFTWERYCEISKWIDENVPNDEVLYGSGHMAQRHNSILCDFSNILAAYGGNYFADSNAYTLGLKHADQPTILDPKFVRALEMYKQVVEASAPDSINWNWSDSAEAFKDGEIAMMPNWDENYSDIENPNTSKVAGKVGYSILPYGDERSANIYGGSGIGINKYAKEEEKLAAWLYIVWATTKEMQLTVLKHPEGGSMPTRKSAYDDPDIVKFLVNPEGEDKVKSFIHMPAVLKAWGKEYQYLRPKLSDFYEIEQVLIQNLHEMVVNDLDPEFVDAQIEKQIRELQY